MSDKLIRVFIGFDPRETIAFHVLSHSINSRSSVPVSITPISLLQLKSVLWRDRNPLQSTDFAFSRFLTPYLCNFEGWAIFMDCDMLVIDDIAHLWSERKEQYAVQVVKHDHRPVENTKFLDHPQLQYEKKNWSSVMLFNCPKCKHLNPNYINSASGLELHRFRWIKNDNHVGEIPHRWNHLAGYDKKVPASNISNIHFTSGGPYFDEYKLTDYSELWFEEKNRMLRCDQLVKNK